jgi:hypothetical protein
MQAADAVSPMTAMTTSFCAMMFPPIKRFNRQN